MTASIAGLGNAERGGVHALRPGAGELRCFTKSGNKPQAANKQETINVNQTETFPVRNGRTNVLFEVTPLSTLECPKGRES